MFDRKATNPCIKDQYKMHCKNGDYPYPLYGTWSEEHKRLLGEAELLHEKLQHKKKILQDAENKAKVENEFECSL